MYQLIAAGSIYRDQSLDWKVMMIPRVKAEFCITGRGLLPDEITDSVKIPPTRTWLEGDSIQGTKLRRKHNGWCLSLGDDIGDMELDDNISELLRILLPRADQINCICSEYDLDCELSCAIRIRDEVPAISFDPQIISALSGLNAALDIDIILT